MTTANAEVAVNRTLKMFFVGISEEMELSALLLGRELGIRTPLQLVSGDEGQGGHARLHKTASKERTETRILADPSGTLHGGVASEAERESHDTERARELNALDIQVYRAGLARFCALLQKHPDLLMRLSKVECP